MIINVPKLGAVRFDDDLTPEQFKDQLLRLAEKFDFELPGEDSKHGLFKSAEAELNNWWGATQKTIGHFLGIPEIEKSGEETLAKSTDIFKPTSDKDVQRAWEKGIPEWLSALGDKYVFEPVGGIAGFAPAIATGAAAEYLGPLVGIGATAAKILGFSAADLPANIGYNMQRQKEVTPDKPINEKAAVAAALGQTMLDQVGVPIGGLLPKGLRKVFGASVDDLATKIVENKITQQAAVDQLSSQYGHYLKAIGANYASLVGMGVGDEALRKAQAGEDYMSPKALSDYKNMLGGAVAPAILFGGIPAIGRRAREEAALRAISPETPTPPAPITPPPAAPAGFYPPPERTEPYTAPLTKAGFLGDEGFYPKQPTATDTTPPDLLKTGQRLEDLSARQQAYGNLFGEPSLGGGRMATPETVSALPEPTRPVVAPGQMELPFQKTQQIPLFPEEVAPPTPPEAKPIITKDALQQTGLSPRAAIFKQLVNKDLSDPEQAQSVANTLARVRDNKLIAPDVKQAVHDLAGQYYYAGQQEMFSPTGKVLKGVDYGKLRTAPDIAPSREGVPVLSEPERIGAAPRITEPTPGRMAATAEPVAGTGVREAAQPRALEEVLKEAAPEFTPEAISEQIEPITEKTPEERKNLDTVLQEHSNDLDGLSDNTNTLLNNRLKDALEDSGVNPNTVEPQNFTDDAAHKGLYLAGLMKDYFDRQSERTTEDPFETSLYDAKQAETEARINNILQESGPGAVKQFEYLKRNPHLADQAISSVNRDAQRDFDSRVIPEAIGRRTAATQPIKLNPYEPKLQAHMGANINDTLVFSNDFGNIKKDTPYVITDATDKGFFVAKPNTKKPELITYPAVIKQLVGGMSWDINPEKGRLKPEESPDQAVFETIKGKPGANISRMAKLLGPQLYGSMKDITPVSVKEMVQNSFDAIKALLEQGALEKGRIDITMDGDSRAVVLKDNGTGMTPDVLANQFLTIAGTNKETAYGSGGFGIAKMLFLYGNKDVEVRTMRDGKISVMRTTGSDLFGSLEDPSKAPTIHIYTPEQYGMDHVKEDFPDGHGTITAVSVPETYEDTSTGKTEPIEFRSSLYYNPVLRFSPLFGNIEVTLNGESLDLGKNFPAHEYTTFANANFKWGTARIYVQREESTQYGDNLHVLSNGLWQFSEKISKDPESPFGSPIPRVFYLDIVSKVKPDEPGYPFSLERKGFSPEARNDLGLIKKYLNLYYLQREFVESSTSFGDIHYLSKKDGDVIASRKENLNPSAENPEYVESISEGSNIQVVDGKLIANGREMPELSVDDLKNARLNVDDLKIDQDRINPNKVMVHDNLLVNVNPYAYRKALRIAEEEKLLDERESLLEGTSIQKTLGALRQLEIQNRLDELKNEYYADVQDEGEVDEFRPISVVAKEKFGPRFDEFMHSIGSVFMALRDRVVYLNLTKALPNYGGRYGSRSYKDLAKEAVGISFDQEYRGVSIKVPFSGLFINPAFPEFIDTPEKAARGMFGTMLHEIAHYQVRSHNADFPAEMQRLWIVLKSDKDFNVNQLEEDLVESVTKNKDILDYLNTIGGQDDSKPTGLRFKDVAYQRRSVDPAADVAKFGREGKPTAGVLGELGPSYQTIEGQSGPRGLPPKAPTAIKGKPLNEDVDDFRITAPSNIAKAPPILQGIARAVQSVFFNTKESVMGLMLTEDIAEAAKKHMRSVTDYVNLTHARTAVAREIEQSIQHLQPRIEALPMAVTRAVNKFLGESTFQGKWGFDPGIVGFTPEVDPAMKQNFKALPPEAQSIVRAVFAHGRNTLIMKQQAIKDHVDDVFSERMRFARSVAELEELEGVKSRMITAFKPVLELDPNTPYAPLKRFGNYVVVAKSQQYYEAEKNEDWKEVRRLKSDENHYIVDFADTMGEARAKKDELAKLNRFMIEEPFKRSEARARLYSTNELHRAFTKLREAVKLKRGDDMLDENTNKMYDKIENLVQELYLTSLADSSARKSEMTRRRIAGYNQDMLRAFFTQGMADARYIANIKHNNSILSTLTRMQEEAKVNRSAAYPYLNEFLAREAQHMEVRTPSFFDAANRFVSDWYLTFSPSFYLQQATQTYTFSLPWMGARFGYFKSNHELTKSYSEVIKLLNKTGIRDNINLDNLPESVTPDEREMLDHLVKMGILDIGVETTMGGYRSEKGALAPYEKVTNNLRSAVNKIEVLNRATTALATFRLALADKRVKDINEATNIAYEAVRTTHGSYDGFNTPRLFNTGPIARSVTQFRRFQIIQLTMLAKQLHNAFAGESPEVRAIGRREAMYLIGHSMILGGMKGMPYWSVGSLAYNIINSVFGDEETKHKDFEAWLREHGGILLTRGLPAWMGIDMSGKLGMGNVLSIAPYTDMDLSSKSGYEKALIGLSGPFMGGMLPNMADGIGFMAQGDYYKGLEKFMPNVVANSMKGVRFKMDGVTSRSGDMLMSPEEVTWTDALLQSVGLPTTKITERSYRAEELYKTQTYFQNTEKNIIHGYTKAIKEGDAEGVQKARMEFMQLQNERVAIGFKRQPLDTLTKAFAAQRKREREVVGGVETTKASKRFAQYLEEVAP